MKTDVDTALRDIADWYVRHRREMTPLELNTILKEHCRSEGEIKQFTQYMMTEPGQLRFKAILKEAKLAKVIKGMPKRTSEELLELDKLGRRIGEERERREREEED